MELLCNMLLYVVRCSYGMYVCLESENRLLIVFLFHKVHAVLLLL